MRKRRWRPVKIRRPRILRLRRPKIYYARSYRRRSPLPFLLSAVVGVTAIWLASRGCSEDDAKRNQTEAASKPEKSQPLNDGPEPVREPTRAKTKREPSGERGIFPEEARETRAQAPENTNRLRFVLRPENDHGKVYCALFDHEAWDAREPLYSDVVQASEGPTTCEFTEMPPGEYALAAFHDENDNEALERSALGLPEEPWALSGKSSLLFGLPTFDAAKFRYDGGTLTLRKSFE